MRRGPGQSTATLERSRLRLKVPIAACHAEPLPKGEEPAAEVLCLFSMLLVPQTVGKTCKGESKLLMSQLLRPSLPCAKRIAGVEVGCMANSPAFESLAAKAIARKDCLA